MDCPNGTDLPYGPDSAARAAGSPLELGEPERPAGGGFAVPAHSPVAAAGTVTAGVTRPLANAGSAALGPGLEAAGPRGAAAGY